MGGLRALALSLQARLTLLLLATASLAGLVHVAIVQWPLPALMALLQRRLGWAVQAPAPGSASALALTALLLFPFLAWMAAVTVGPLQRLLRALQGAVLSYREGDFSMSIRAPGHAPLGELGELLRLHSELGMALRDQRQQLAQRELLLDTVVQNTPLALLLCDEGGQIVYANIAARQMLAEGRRLVGNTLDTVLADAPPDLRDAVQSGQDQLFSVSDSAGHEEHFHLSQRPLLLQGVRHRLILLRRMTRELAREEVASWKRVIRVISHELNNSLAPISSLAHSGAELARRGQAERLPRVFDSIAERASHLHTFLAGYARFAKLPQPRPEPVDWPAFLDRLGAHSQFSWLGAAPASPPCFDAGQVEQALINLLKNAHESGSAAQDISLALATTTSEMRFTVADRGPGMSDTVLAQALLPFYSTKRSGTGLGLALAREIAEAHGGRIALANREGGGLAVTLVLPVDASR
ncbi:sensor histidine kinase [Ideonella sp.]|uniref:sensor histidine kinase n=1 Tax=Ideonella sp. TaxID=1929293 RepID=UPI002B46EBE2|nr:ATP-binding protein [Ideonella sp.]HJV68609.1 ATP-binding protein [Ideonella sp.]